MPVISVVMPVYRQAKFVPAAIESVLSQTFGDFELICVDGRDGGEECRDVIESYVAKDARVKYMIQNDVGVGDARNTGLNYASGEYFAAHDSDDISNPQRLHKQLAFLKGSQDYTAVIGGMSIINAEGKTVTPYKKKGGKGNLKGQAARADLLCYRSAVLATGGYRSLFPLYEDVDFALRFIERGFVTGIMDEESYLVRQHNSYRLFMDFSARSKYICVAYYCAYCRKILGKDPVNEGKSLDKILEELGGIHLPIKDIFDNPVMPVGFGLKNRDQSFSLYFIRRCRQDAQKSMKYGNYSDFISIIRFMESYHGVDKISKKYVWRMKIHLLWHALRYGHLGYFKDIRLRKI